MGAGQTQGFVEYVNRFQQCDLTVAYELSSEWLDTIRLFSWKVSANVSDTAYNALRRVVSRTVDVESLFVTRQYLQSQLGLSIKKYHHCINNCVAFTGHYSNYQQCPYCDTS